MDYAEEVETVLPAGYTIASNKKDGRINKGGLFSHRRGISKKFSKIRQKTRSRSRSVSRDAQVVNKSTVPSAPSHDSNATQKQTNTVASKIIKEDRRDTEEVPPSLQPTREGSPSPTTECSLSDGSADNQPPADSQPKPSVADDDESTIIDTTSIYGMITGVLSPRKSFFEEVKEEEDEGAFAPVESLLAATAALMRGVSSKRSTTGKQSLKPEPIEQDANAATPEESLLTATAALARGQSGVSVSSKKSTISKSAKKSVKSEPTKQDTEDEMTHEQEEEALIDEREVEKAVVAKQEEEPASGHTWAKNISLKVGGFETSIQMADPVATITDKVNQVMDEFDSELVKQAEALEHKEEELDYEENPTKLFLLLQQKAWGLAMMQLEKHPEEAEIWVYRKFIPEKAPNVHDASDPDKSEALVKQETALSTVVNEPSKYRWRLLPLHASIVLGAPQEVTTKILHTYPDAARKVDERGSLPVHLAASRLDVDQEGEKVVLQLFGAYAESIDIEDRRRRTAPELAKLARARKAAEKQRLMETASRTSRACIETSKNWREEGDDDDRSVKSSFSARFRNMMKGSKSMGDVETAKANGSDDAIVADAEGMAPGFAFLTAAKSTDERDAQNIADKSSKEQPEEEMNPIPELSLPESKSFGDGSVRSTKSGASVTSVKSKSSKQTEDDASDVSTAADSAISPASLDPQAALRAVLEKACENAGRPGMDVTKFLVFLEAEWVTDVEAIRRLDGGTLDSILPIMLSRELQRLVNHSNIVDGEYLRPSRGCIKKKHYKYTKKNKKKRSARSKPASRLHLALDPINEEGNENAKEEEVESAYTNRSAVVAEGEDNTATDKTDDASIPSHTSASCTEEGNVEDDMHKNHAVLILEARAKFPTREALEDAIHERQAAVNLAVGSGFDVDKQTLAQAAFADNEVRKLLPLRLVLPSVADLKEMVDVLQSHKEKALKSFDVANALKIQIEIDEIETQIDEEEKYLRRKSVSQTSCAECGANFETKKKMVGILKKNEMVCDNCRKAEV